MNAERRALRPLWMLATGVTIGAAGAVLTTAPAPTAVSLALVVGGATAVIAVLLSPRLWALWLLAGLALAGGLGLHSRSRQLELERILKETPAAAPRVRATLVEGWTPERWGWRTRVTVTRAWLAEQRLDLPSSCRLEVRGSVRPELLPRPGATVEALAAPRGEPLSPLLVVSSQRLLEEVRGPHGLSMVRDRLATALFEAAGTDERRIRAAEMAAALALGRRDLLPEDRREGWRRSGLAHMLSVSGLHVGMVAAVVWLIAAAIARRPRSARVTVLIALPVYTLLAGAAPSAIRAALMGMLYVGARLLGRALMPMASVLLASTVLLLARPELVADAGFQLTVLITAALIRWVVPLADATPLPRWLGGALAVPVVAQIASAPIAAWHFSNAVPGAVVANLVVPLVLAPTMVAALAAPLVAPLSTTLGGWCLDAVGIGDHLLWVGSSAGRAAQLVLPSVPALAVAGLVVAGWLALQPGRRARWGVAGWILACVLTSGWWWLRPSPAQPRVELLPVSEGLSAVVATAGGAALLDGGRWRDEAARLLAERGFGRFEVVLASHGDEDHVGGLIEVLGSARVGLVAVPAWLPSEPTSVPLLRVARRAGVPVVPVASGSVLRLGDVRLEVLWPPAIDPPALENERSLVARIVQPEGAVLLTSDIGRATELTLVTGTWLGCAVLIAPHHGSRGSSTAALLGAADPGVVLIPAGPENIHGHPHPEVLARLEEWGIPIRYPARDGPCGAAYRGGEWAPYP